MLQRFSAVLVLLSLSAPIAAADENWRGRLEPFAKSHCYDCHQGSEAEAGLDLAKLGGDLSDLEVTRQWTLIYDRVARGEMPPKDVGTLPAKDKAAALKTLAGALTAAERKRASVVLRRLNRIEYENTVRDLFGVYVRVKDLLPKDTPAHGFDNVGEGLAVSAEAMQAYLRAADVTLDAVFGPPKEPKRIKLTTNLAEQRDWKGRLQLESQFGKMFRKTEKGLVIFQSRYCPTNLVNFSRLRPPAGTYRVKMEVRALQSKEPVTLRVYGGDTVVGRREKHLVGYFDIVPGGWRTIEFEDRLVEDGGCYQPKCYATRDIRKNADTYDGPGIEIADIHMEGPLESWPPPSRKKLLGEVDPQKGTVADAEAILNRVVPRAFRRPVEPDELDIYVRMVDAALQSGRTFEEALRLALKAVLCSPEFLFLEEPGAKQISQHALASRLSYFLWSSMPDEQLMALAAEGKLKQPNELREQVERMLADPKAEAFTKNFTGQWLDLRDIDFTEPDMKLFPEFDELLKISMVEETERFFQAILDENLSLMNFIDSDFTFLNERLARHYGIPGVKGQEFRKVKLPPESVRGGVLTQGSVLKVTANGTNTSPVLRGNWVLENILCRPTSPPPDGVGSVEPDIRGAKTLREQLARHRSVSSCAMCHDRIDPPGFALENFDPIGGWRENYRTIGDGERPDIKQAPFTNAWVRYRIGLPVDATGQTEDGKKFEDIRAFKKLLARDQDQITRGLTQKLLTYAIGRRVGFSDRPHVEAIVRKVRGQDYGFRSLVHEVVQSELFQRP